MTTLAGLEVKTSDDMTRIQAVCEHQRGPHLRCTR